MGIPASESQFAKYKKSLEGNECYETTPEHFFALGVTADDSHEYFFGTAQFLDAELAANPAIEKKEYAPPERLHLRPDACPRHSLRLLFEGRLRGRQRLHRR